MNRTIPSLLPPRQLGRVRSSFYPSHISHRRFHRGFTHRLKYQFIEDVEPLWRYSPGGLHPVHIGDQFHNRYRVVDKLGFGDSSTVWLARDNKINQLVAIKIIDGSHKQKEADILSALRNATGRSENQRNSFFPPVLDRFEVRGVNGVHSCYVTEPAMINLENFKGSPLYRFEMDVARVLVAQMVLSMAAMHSQGYVHGENVLLRFPSSAFRDLSDQQFYDKYGEPSCEPITPIEGAKRPPSLPSYGVVPAWLGCEKGKEDRTVPVQDARIWIVDLGHSFAPPAEPECASGSIFEYCAPEFLFSPENSKVSFSSDIFSLGVCTWNLLSPCNLFTSFLGAGHEIMPDHVDLFGPSGMPSSWWDKWEGRSEYYTETRDLVPDYAEHVRSWDVKFKTLIQDAREEYGYPQISPEEKEAIYDTLRPMLALNPDDRCTAAQVLKSKWMTQWALPEYQKLKK
ncbi:kinase-like protein [Daldinia vernicosa]|uniref:kinase-like protein n=1 Tax=Daldinia vernicosa TaxID=114800 RepID=UPI002008390F|nr:kinase-like protein [Daldinia vernicosa]KAI0853435.1 kinase-like protein [Daldinia vernicosa]